MRLMVKGAANLLTFKNPYMNTTLASKEWDKTMTIITLFIVGIGLAVIKIFFYLFPLGALTDTILFFVFGYIFGAKVYHKKWSWGVLLALPAIGVCLYFLSHLKGEAIISGAGINEVISIVVMSLAACLGMFLRIKHKQKIPIIDNNVLE